MHVIHVYCISDLWLASWMTLFVIFGGRKFTKPIKVYLLLLFSFFVHTISLYLHWSWTHAFIGMHVSHMNYPGNHFWTWRKEHGNFTTIWFLPNKSCVYFICFNEIAIITTFFKNSSNQTIPTFVICYCNTIIFGWVFMISVGFNAAARYLDSWYLFISCEICNGVDIEQVLSYNACSVRVSNELGARSPKSASLSCVLV